MQEGDVTRKCISCILEVREILLSFQNGFNLVIATVVCAILETLSGLELSYNWAQELEDCDCLKLLSIYFISGLMPLVSFVICLVFSALMSMP